MKTIKKTGAKPPKDVLLVIIERKHINSDKTGFRVPTHIKGWQQKWPMDVSEDVIVTDNAKKYVCVASYIINVSQQTVLKNRGQVDGASIASMVKKYTPQIQEFISVYRPDIIAQARLHQMIMEQSMKLKANAAANVVDAEVVENVAE